MAVSRHSGKAQRRHRQEALSVQLSVKVRFGEHDSVTMIDDRQIPMIGGVLKYRDRIARGFLGLMLKAAAHQPKIVRELAAFNRLAHMAQARREPTK